MTDEDWDSMYVGLSARFSKLKIQYTYSRSPLMDALPDYIRYLHPSESAKSITYCYIDGTSQTWNLSNPKIPLPSFRSLVKIHD